MFEQIEPMLADLITLVIIALIGYATTLLRTWLKESGKEKQFVQAYRSAEGLWVYLEEYAPALIGEEKMAKMKEILHIDFPLLSDSQLTAINKEAHLKMEKLYNELNPPTEQ